MLLVCDDSAGVAGKGRFQTIDVSDNAGAAFFAFGKSDGGFDFWKHGASFEVAEFFVGFEV